MRFTDIIALKANDYYCYFLSQKRKENGNMGDQGYSPRKNFGHYKRALFVLLLKMAGV